MFVSSGYIPGSRFAGSYGGSSLSFFRKHTVLATVTATISFPSTVYQDSLFSTSWPIYGFRGLVNGSYSDRCEVVSHFGFNVHFSEHLFMCLLIIHVSSLEKYLFKFSAHLLITVLVCFWMLSCMNCLYALGINPLSVISFANISSYSEGMEK